MWKDILMILFNLIDYNHSGFISRNEFADVMKLVLHGENGSEVNDDYIEELSGAMDFDRNGKIDMNEFLGKGGKKETHIAENFSWKRFFLFL